MPRPVEVSTDECTALHVYIDEDLFVGEIRPATSVRIKGVSGTSAVEGTCSIEFTFNNEIGIKHKIVFKNTIITKFTYAFNIYLQVIQGYGR